MLKFIISQTAGREYAGLDFKTSYVEVYHLRGCFSHFLRIISKHLMLKFIFDDLIVGKTYYYFKTSYVEVYQVPEGRFFDKVTYFKTSYVEVYLNVWVKLPSVC